MFIWLSGQGWFNEGANIIQWTGAPALLLGWLMWRKRRCKVPWCLRLGRHEVADSTWKVCANHHTHKWHFHVRAAHAEKHPERLGHGESPGR